MKKNYILIALVLLSSSIFAQLSESFEGTFPPTGWTRQMPDAGTGWTSDTVGTAFNGWTGTATVTAPTGGGNQIARFTWSDGGAASNDSWLISPKITITASEGLYFWANKFFAYADTLEIYVSTTDSNLTSFTKIGTIGNWSGSWTHYTYNLSSYSGMNVFVAFRSVVNDNQNFGDYVGLDVVEVKPLPANDAALISINGPTSACTLSATESVVITVKNNGSTSLSNIPVNYKFNNGSTVTESMPGPIAPFATANYTFTQKVNAATPGLDSVVVWTSLSSDGDTTNNKVPAHYFANLQGSAPFSNGFETTMDDLGNVITDVNADGFSWAVSTSATYAHGGTYFITYGYNSSSATTPGDDWFITKCIHLTPGMYNVSFWYRGRSATYTEKLEVKYGSTQSVAGMTNSIVALTAITNIAYQQSITPITITAAGDYYFGFHCNSDPDMYNLFVDDIAIAATGVGINENNPVLFNIFPNPAKNHFRIESSDKMQQISLINGVGQTIFHADVQDNQYEMNTSDMAQGVYYVKIKTEYGTTTKKLVIE